MNGVSRIVNRCLGAALVLLIASYAAVLIHDFYLYVDRSIFVSVDDAEANIAYSVATSGSYGFPASPVLVGLDRSQYQFNYGPWYFYFAGGLTWLLGFSLTLVRSIHLLGVAVCMLAAAWWFRGRDGLATAAVFALGLMYCFEASHWPMARPDIMVSVFAVLLFAAAGIGLQTSRPLAWFLAGVGATCGAFTHLIALSMMPSAAVLLLTGAVLDFVDESDQVVRRRKIVRAFVAMAAGATVGLLMFYGSIGFRFNVQREFLSAYRDVTASTVTPIEALQFHLAYAYNYLTPMQRYGVATTLGASVLVSALSLFWGAERRRLVLSYLLPPTVVWAAYGASNMFYTNYHQGYAILHQVAFLWTLTSLCWVGLSLLRQRFPRVGAMAGTVAVILLLLQGGRLMQWQLSGESWKNQRRETWAPFAEYSARVVGAVPAWATAWGSIIFALETPGRGQIVQWADAASLFSEMPPARRAELTPDFVIWSYPEMRDNMIASTRGQESLLHATARLIGDEHRYRLVSMVAAAPYGVTRTWARFVGEPASRQSPPSVAVYEAHSQRWLTRVGAPLPTVFAPVAPMTVRLGYEREPPAATPQQSVSASLAADRYLLRVVLRPGDGEIQSRLLTATSPDMLRQTMGEAGPNGDFAAYLGSDREIYLLAIHTGGPLFVSQFDAGAGAAILSVEAMPIMGLLDPAEQPRQSTDLPALASWTATPNVAIAAEGAGIRVTGSNVPGEYQVSSPLIALAEHRRVTVRAPLTVETGAVCAGILNGSGARWLVPPDMPRAELRFSVDATQGFRVVAVNCGRAGESASRFVMWPGDYQAEPFGAAYARSLMDAAFGRASVADDLAGPDVRTLPPGLPVSKTTLALAVNGLTPDAFGYRAPNISFADGRWTTHGQSEGGFTYLLQSNARRFSKDERVVISGRVERGGVTFGFQRNNAWDGQIHVIDNGPFTVVLAPSGNGTYTLVAANNLPGPLDTAIVIDRMAIVRPQESR